MFGNKSKTIITHIVVAVVQLLSRVQLFLTPWTVPLQAPLSSAISQSSLTFMSIESMMLSNHIVLCLSLLLLPSIFPSIRVFSSESALQIRFSKVLELQLQHQAFQWKLRIDFFYNWPAWSPCSPWDSQESSPAPQFKSTNSLALRLYGPILIAVHEY